jgi:hypothetical protein
LRLSSRSIVSSSATSCETAAATSPSSTRYVDVRLGDRHAQRQRHGGDEHGSPKDLHEQRRLHGSAESR